MPFFILSTSLDGFTSLRQCTQNSVVLLQRDVFLVMSCFSERKKNVPPEYVTSHKIYQSGRDCDKTHGLATFLTFPAGLDETLKLC